MFRIEGYYIIVDFALSFLKLSALYYVGGCVLQFFVPTLVRVKRLQRGKRPKAQIFRDAWRSVGPLAVKALIWTVVKILHDKGIGQLYQATHLSFAEIAYSLWTVVVLDVLHDAWFYLTHRWLHSKPLYRLVHYLHHQSRVPSAFTAYSFHISEAFLVFANEVLVCFVFPIDLRLHRIYHLLSTLIHQGGHVGYEISPYSPMLSNILFATLLPRNVWIWLTTYWMNTVQHHDMHHTHVGWHFSLYYTHWDRLLKTLHPNYDRIVNHYLEC